MVTNFSAAEQRAEESTGTLLAHGWGWLALRGVLAIILGVLAFVLPGVALGSLTLLFALYMLADGVLGIGSAVRAAKADRGWGWLLVEAVLSIVAGAATLLLPGIAILTFVLLVSVWAVISGVALLVAAFRLHKTHGRWWMALGGALSILWGTLLLTAPSIGAIVLALWIAAYAVAFGLALLLLSLRLRAVKRSGRDVGTS